jgi:hypothetical protein
MRKEVERDSGTERPDTYLYLLTYYRSRYLPSNNLSLPYWKLPFLYCFWNVPHDYLIFYGGQQEKDDNGEPLQI